MKVWFNEHGNLTAKVPLSWALPEVLVHRKIGNTEYCVSGSYDGKQALPAKLLHLAEIAEETS